MTGAVATLSVYAAGAMAVAAAVVAVVPLAPPAPAQATVDVVALIGADLWSDWRDRFVTAEGRVVDDGNHGISHSEGQGYGMLLAVFAGDRATLDRQWTWTREKLGLRGDGLFAWRYDPSAAEPVADRNNATDGDLLIAWALAEAGRRWPDGGYAGDAAVIARAVQRETVVDRGGLRLLLPGADGFSAEARPDGPVVNPSYWVFPAFHRLAEVAPEHDWARLATDGREIAGTAFGERALPPDWLALGLSPPGPADGFPAEFGWNAVRVPLYFAWAGLAERADLARYAALWPDGWASEPRAVDLRTGATRPFGEAGYRAIPALVGCALEGRRFPAEMKAPTDEPYYPATLRLLALAAAAERYPACL
jgi:endo-1,4-beta-D-glucanase Y